MKGDTKVKIEIITLLKEEPRSLKYLQGLYERHSRQKVYYNLKSLIEEKRIVPFLKGNGLDYSERYFRYIEADQKKPLELADIIDKISKDIEAEKQFLEAWLSSTEQNKGKLIVASKKEFEQPSNNLTPEIYAPNLENTGLRIIYAIKMGVLTKEHLANLVIRLSYPPGTGPFKKEKEITYYKNIIDELDRIEEGFRKRGIDLELIVLDDD